MENKELSPQEYFDEIKNRKQHITDEQLTAVYNNCLELLDKYRITGQISGMKKLMFHIGCIEKEREIVKMGIDTFVYRDDIEYYIDQVSSDVVKIIDIGSYEREIPDEIVDVIAKVKDIFDQLYIVFTDYTGKVERRVKKERRARDPILFGTFLDEGSRSVIDRFYYLGDWVDEYCELTLDKMVNETEKVGKRNIVKKIKTPEDIDELRVQLASLSPSSKSSENFAEYRITDSDKKHGLFYKIKTFFMKDR